MLALTAVGAQASASPPADAQDASLSRGTALDVYFERRSVELTDEALAIIAANAKRLKSEPSLCVTLVGYADEDGSSSYGVALAQHRASVVTSALIGMGVDARQIRTTAYYDEKTSAALPCAADRCGDVYRKVEFKYPKPLTADLQWQSQPR